jgi:hypothetical protein
MSKGVNKMTSCYPIFRRYYRLSDPFLYNELVCIFTEELQAIEFVNNDSDKTENQWLHRDTYTVQGYLNQIYNNGLETNIKLAVKEFHFN